MSDLRTSPGDVEVYGSFRRHVGPRFIAAGVGVQFHANQPPGIHFKVDVPSEYRDSIQRGLQDGLVRCFPNLPSSASIWVTRVDVDEVDSSPAAFYLAARMVIEQAYLLSGGSA